MEDSLENLRNDLPAMDDSTSYGGLLGKNASIFYPHDSCLIFDLETGHRLDWPELLLPGWEDHCVLPDGAPESGISPDTLTLCSVMSDSGSECLYIYLSNGSHYFSLLVPYSYFAL